MADVWLLFRAMWKVVYMIGGYGTAGMATVLVVVLVWQAIKAAFNAWLEG